MKIKTSNCWFFNILYFLSEFNESRMSNNSDKMCLFYLEYFFVKTTFIYQKGFKPLLTFLSRKLEDQQELVILLVQAVNDYFFNFVNH